MTCNLLPTQSMLGALVKVGTKTLLLSALSFLIVANQALAAGGMATLSLEYVGAASATHPLPAARNLLSFGFNSTSALGACPLEGGKVYFEGDPADKEMLAVLLAAHAAGRPVRFWWDDTFVNSRGYCKITSARAY